MSADTKFKAYIAQCPHHERLRLAAWPSSNNGKRVKYGAVVRAPIEELFEDELMRRITNEPHIYGIATYEEEYDEQSTVSAWAVNWATEHLLIPKNVASFSLVCGMDETKMEVTMNPGDDLPTNSTYPFADHFGKNDRGDWTIKEYDPRCEFCACRDCERMQQKDDLDEGVRDLMMNDDLTNKQRRYQMYRDWIRFKFGCLGPGERKPIDKCVRILIVAKFPPPVGTELTGFCEA